MDYKKDWSALSDDDLFKLWQDEFRRNLKYRHNFENDLSGIRRSTTKKFLKQLGIDDDLDQLSVIHVTGTKGKGSTCFFTEKILQTCGFKTGMICSPPLTETRERIRLNGKVVPRRMFATYGLEVLQMLEKVEENFNELEEDKRRPNLFQYMMILGLYIFLKEKVDVVIFEVFVGGETDYSNVFRVPTVVGLTTLGIDHTEYLGNTLESIAWHKSGIAKKDRPFLTLSQPKGPLKVIALRTMEIEVSFSTWYSQLQRISRQTRTISHRLHTYTHTATPYVCPPLSAYETDGKAFELGLHGDFQRDNAALAVQLARRWIEEKHPGRYDFKDLPARSSADEGIPVVKPFVLPDPFEQGLKNCSLPGRHQVVRWNHVTFYCDTASNEMSVASCKEWFHLAAEEERERLGVPVTRVLMFSMRAKDKTQGVLTKLADYDFDATIFCPSWMIAGTLPEAHPAFYAANTKFTFEGEMKNTEKLKTYYEEALDKLGKKKRPIVKTASSIPAALRWAVGTVEDLRDLPPLQDCESDDEGRLDVAGHVQVMVTGNFYIVGQIVHHGSRF
ncbi:folylpolyglutamate synthase, mitochondrial-like [Diadema setosum]|uniref:folylpolyglutamate synthase, mitochondrial-like n=1 Tax=Diadema setosum TaxID=31175 RepID=UPI003B3BD350